MLRAIVCGGPREPPASLRSPLLCDLCIKGGPAPAAPAPPAFPRRPHPLPRQGHRPARSPGSDPYADKPPRRRARMAGDRAEEGFNRKERKERKCLVPLRRSRPAPRDREGRRPANPFGAFAPFALFAVKLPCFLRRKRPPGAVVARAAKV